MLLLSFVRFCAALHVAHAATLQVGPDKTYATPCAAATHVQDGDTVAIDAGVYSGDVCAWTADRLTLRGVGGYAHLEAAGQASGGKAIWVIQGDDTTVESIEFSGASVPDHNGAGIRQEGTNLTVRHCYFHDNEDGILAGDNPLSDILVTDSEFVDNGFGDGLSHNLYINHVSSFTFEFSSSHRSYKGHALKSRAAETFVLYSRLADDAEGQGSYQIDLPNGGFAVVLGNVIQQGPAAENGGMLTFAEEGATNEYQLLYVVNNTFVNDRGSGTFVRNSSENAAVLTNNLFVGGGTALDGAGVQHTCLETTDGGFLDAANGDYRLAAGAAAIDAGSDPGDYDGYVLWPAWQMATLGAAEARPVVGALDVGAIEFGTAPEDSGDSGGSADSGDSGETGDSAESAPIADGADPDGQEGCGCASAPAAAGVAPLLAVVSGLWAGRRRRSATA